MSGEYFFPGSQLIEQMDDKINDCPYGGDCPTICEEDKPDIKLHEMGEALEIAENRCNTLKEQLDQMKSMYRDRTCKEKRDCSKDRRCSPIRHKNLQRQSPGVIATDNSGAAVLTINNILTGITNSINRLSELHTFIDNDKTTSRKKRFRDDDKKDRHCGENFHRTFSENCYSKLEKKPVTKKRNKRNEAQSSTQMITRNKIRLKEEIKVTSNTSIKKQKKLKRLKQLSKTSISKKNKILVKDITVTADNLVELYHNEAAKESDSDESVVAPFVPPKGSVIDVKAKKKIDLIPPIPIPPTTAFVRTERSLSPIDENMDALDVANRHDFIGHNYEMPTIASKMKQVAKGYFRQFPSKTIPFCAATSTTPSHNIGINIQQVMNIIKTRQPIQGISPTLAHNIGLAAERLNHSSLSAMVSTLGSRIGYNMMPCPMLKNHFNYQQLQEFAKDIPDECAEEQYAEELISNNPKSICIPESPRETNWGGDPNSQGNCTCIPRQGVGFQQVLNKFQITRTPGTANSQSLYSQKIMKKSYQKYKNIRSVYAQYNGGPCSKRKINDSPIDFQWEDSAETNMPLKGKAKVLKGVLVNLHDEFGQLSEKYDQLSQSIQNENREMNETEAKELDGLEKKLNEKEEEIQMVMSLYNEVANLKQQVRLLREKTSMASLMVEQQKQNYGNMGDSYRIPKNKNMTSTNAAVRLTRMLRQIHNYKDVQKNGGK